jgi:hypothetical protein
LAADLLVLPPSHEAISIRHHMPRRLPAADSCWTVCVLLRRLNYHHQRHTRHHNRVLFNVIIIHQQNHQRRRPLDQLLLLVLPAVEE